MKHELDRRVARELRVSRATVSRVTSEFLRQASILLAESGFVLLNSFGSLRVHLAPETGAANLKLKKGRRSGTRKVVVPTYIRVHFSKSKVLKRLLDEHYKE